MQIVIDIPKYVYDTILAYDGYIPDCDNEKVGNALKNGIILPKGHGDLKDSNLLDTILNFVLNHTGGYKNTPIGTGIVIAMAENLDADTIIKAESEELDET